MNPIKKENHFNCKEFGKQVKLARNQANLSTNQLGDKCDLDPSYIRQIESGSKLPSLPTFVKICKIESARAVEKSSPPSGRMRSTAAMPAASGRIARALRIRQVSKLNTCSNRNKKPKSVTDAGGGQFEHYH